MAPRNWLWGTTAPDHFVSLPLGAARLTRDLQLADPPGAKQVAALQELVAAEVAQSLAVFRAEAIDTAVGTSKTLRSLARVGAAPSNEGPRARRVLTREDAAALVEQLAGMPSVGPAKLPGVSQHRAPQLLDGAVAAATTMNMLGIEELRICPWALREGIMLTQRDATAAVRSWAEASGGGPTHGCA